MFGQGAGTGNFGQQNSVSGFDRGSSDFDIMNKIASIRE